MLVLSRRKGEKVCVGDGIMITVCGVRGGKVRLGIEAPPEVHVARQEILNRIQAASGQPQPETAEPPAS